MTKTIKRFIYSAVTCVVLAVGAMLLIHEVNAQSTPAANTDSNEPFKVDGDTITVSSDAARTAGIDTIELKTTDVPSTLTLSGRTDLDQERVTHVHAQFPGRVVHVGPPDKNLQLGDNVVGPGSRGGATILCTIESVDLNTAKSNYLQAAVQLALDRENLSRTQKLLDKQILAEKYLLDAQAAVTKSEGLLDAARQQLLVFGLTDQDIKDISNQHGKQRMTYDLTSPRSGMVVEKGVVGGELADPTLNLFTVADTSTLWVWGDVYERDRLRVKEGQTMKVILTSDPEHPRMCKVAWVSPVVDSTTRSIKIRGSMDNRDGHLLAQMYATLVVTVSDGKGSIIAPATAVVRKGPQAYAFVQSGTSHNGITFRRTPIKVEPIDAGPGLDSLSLAVRDAASRTPQAGSLQNLRIVQGVAPGQRIVQSGALGLFNEMEQQQSQLQDSHK